MKILCPQCGADFHQEEVDSFVICDFCKSSLFIDLDKITAVYTVKPVVEPHQISIHLKRDFEKMGFDEEIKVVQSLPILFPFWEVEGSKRWQRASTRFPDDSVLPVSAGRQFFDKEGVDFRIDVAEIDSQPASENKRILHYYPFYWADVRFRDKSYQFYINAVSGGVIGDPIPFISGTETNRLFPLFSVIFFSFLLINYFFDHFLLTVGVNAVAFYLFYQVATHLTDKQESET